MIELEFNVTDTTVTLVSEKTLPSGNLNTIHCVFTFSSDYDTLIKRACFNNEYVLVSDNQCNAPMLDTGIYTIGVYGYELDSENAYKTVLSPTPVKVRIVQGSFDEEISEATTLSPTELEEFYAKVDSGYFKGDKGDNGEDAKVTVGSTTTLDAGSDAYVWYDTEANNTTVLYFNIPRGDKGEQGVSITKVEINSEGHLIVTLSNGNTFDCGNTTGEQGQKASVIVDTTTTLEAGLQATVDSTYDETSNTTTLAFGIPKGDKGDKGDTYTLTETDQSDIATIVTTNYFDEINQLIDDSQLIYDIENTGAIETAIDSSGVLEV